MLSAAESLYYSCTSKLAGVKWPWISCELAVAVNVRMKVPCFRNNTRGVAKSKGLSKYRASTQLSSVAVAGQACLSRSVATLLGMEITRHSVQGLHGDVACKVFLFYFKVKGMKRTPMQSLLALLNFSYSFKKLRCSPWIMQNQQAKTLMLLSCLFYLFLREMCVIEISKKAPFTSFCQAACHF